MNNDTKNFDFEELEGRNIKEYIQLIRTNLISFLVIIIIGTAAGIFYALRSPDIYVSETSIKISKSGGSVLQSQPLGDFGEIV